MARYRKKPVEIEAFLWDGSVKGAFGLFNFVTCDLQLADDGTAYIHTLEGVMAADPGDWIIRGVKGEFYPCKPDIFALTYDEVD